MTGDRRAADGRFSTRYADQVFVDAVRELSLAGTSEVADIVGCTTQNADYRLRQLEADGWLTSKKVGGRLVWTAVAGSSTVRNEDVTGQQLAEAAEDDRAETAHRAAATTFFERAHDRVGDAFAGLYLFGSVARGRATETSDVDILAIIAGDADFTTVDEQLLDLAYDVGVDHGVQIEVHAIREPEFSARIERGDPFVRAVIEDGEALG